MPDVKADLAALTAALSSILERDAQCWHAQALTGNP
jgi:hypothetical protein